MTHIMEFSNPHLKSLHETGDFLYHFNINTKDEDFSKFSDVRFVCMGGKPSRMQLCAKKFHFKILDLDEEGMDSYEPENLTGSLDRYVLYKEGPALFVSHGVGVSTLSVALHEMIKLVQHAGCSNVTFLRVGTSGGLGVDPGTVVITNKALTPGGQEHHPFTVLGKTVTRPARLSQEVIDGLKRCSDDSYIITGGTMCADDFYEGQGRLDGAVCEHGDQEKQAFLKGLYELGTRNIEMEATLFSALLNHVNIPHGILCVTLVDRLKGDQVKADEKTLKMWESRPVDLLVKYMVTVLKESE